MAHLPFSSNCSTDSRVMHVCEFSYANSSDGGAPPQKGSLLSCQPSDMDGETDAKTLRSMREMAVGAAGELAEVDPKSVSCRPMAQPKGIDLTGKELLEKGMASNCGPSFDLRNVSGTTDFVCRYMGTGKSDEGGAGSNPFRTWKGKIASCDAGDSSQTQEDVRKIAFEMMGGKDAGLEKKYVLCDSMTL